MRPRPARPSWKRIGIEYAGLVAVYFVVYFFTRQVWIAFIAMLLALFVILATRPRKSRTPPASKGQ